MTLLLGDIVTILSQYPSLYNLISLENITHFVNLSKLVKPYVSLAQSIYEPQPPDALPEYVHSFLCASLRLDGDIVKLLWTAFRQHIWDTECDEEVRRNVGKQYIPHFLREGISRNINFYCLLPPVRTCLDPKCQTYARGSTIISRPRQLGEPKPVQATVFSRDYGPLPATSVSLYCRGCNTRYYHNYYVHEKASKITYYREQPRFVHGTASTFVDKETCLLFTNMMLHAWTSARNCAQIYNNSIADNEFHSLLPLEWRRLRLDVELVWNSLFLFWLLEDCAENSKDLELDRHAPSQAQRISKGLKERNLDFIGVGHPNWNHACDSCCWVSEDANGVPRAVRSVVVDGIAIGRPCCGVHDCPNPLLSVKRRFCQAHDHLNSKCCVTNCSNGIQAGFQTCADPEHRKLEVWVHEQNKAMFQLKRRMVKAGVPHTGDVVDNNLGEDFEDDYEIDIYDIQCEGKPASGNRQVKARFGRRRTHNEELAVYSCGVICGRATFYGSEAPNGVRLFLMRLFPTKASLPQVIWHDNNCQIQAMLRNDPSEADRTYFEDCAMPVDVFHFKCKHKETDVNCNKYCNPLNWKELVTEGGKWRFNSSAAEQANVWFGRYLPIVREMESVRYDFFLDEMIKRRNRLVIQDLQEKGKFPYSIPRQSLLG